MLLQIALEKRGRLRSSFNLLQIHLKKLTRAKLVDKETETLDVQSLEDAPEDAGDELSVISKSFPGAQIINEET